MNSYINFDDKILYLMSYSAYKLILKNKVKRVLTLEILSSLLFSFINFFSFNIYKISALPFMPILNLVFLELTIYLILAITIYEISKKNNFLASIFG